MPPQCRHCGQPIVGRGPTAIYCSRQCAIRASMAQRRQRKPTKAATRNCVVCNRRFPSRGPSHVCCSRACGIKRSTINRRERREAAKRPLPRTCLFCAGPIPRRKPARYCNQKCRGSHASQLMEEKGLREGMIPTPEQIRERAEAIQRGWSDREREAHLTAKPTIFHVPGTV